MRQADVARVVIRLEQASSSSDRDQETSAHELTIVRQDLRLVVEAVQELCTESHAETRNLQKVKPTAWRQQIPIAAYFNCFLPTTQLL